MSEQDLLRLIAQLRTTGKEAKTVDAKRELSLQEQGDKAEFVKDIAAMANNGEPSYLVIGVEDGTFADVGPLTYYYKQNDINQLLAGKIDPPVIIEYKEFKVNSNEYALVKVSGHNPPYIIARELVHNKSDRKQVRLYKGMVYVRHQDRTEGITRAELDQLLQRQGIQREFVDESIYAQELVLTQPDFWEYLLTAELLERRGARIQHQVHDLNRGVHFVPARIMRGAEFHIWLQAKIEDLTRLNAVLNVRVDQDFATAWGAPGEPGDPLAIKRTVDNIIGLCDRLIDWEIDLRSVVPPTTFAPLRQMMEGWTMQYIDELSSIPDKLRAPFTQPNPSGRYIVELIFYAPENINELSAELQRLKERPLEWIDEW